MFINPKVAIEEGWVTGVTDPDNQLQPNALDFTLDKLFSINANNTFVISEGGKKMRGGGEIESVEDRGDPKYKFWTMMPDTVYDGMSNIHVKLPEGVAAQLIIRSTFNRNGIFLTSGLYDSGFEGSIGFAIHNRSGVAKVGQGTRVGQIIFIRSDSAGVYAGQYNTDEGDHWTDARDPALPVIVNTPEDPDGLLAKSILLTGDADE